MAKYSDAGNKIKAPIVTRQFNSEHLGGNVKLVVKNDAKE
jgi:hypothetical protein